MSASDHPPTQSEERRVKAIAVSRGIGIGPAVFLPESSLHSEHRKISAKAIETEIDRLRFGVDRSRANLDELVGTGTFPQNGSITGIFDTHLLILDSFAVKVEDRIRANYINVEWAIDTVLREAFERHGVGTPAHLREKQLDLKDVAAGILGELRSADRIQYPKGSVIIAGEIRPSTVVEFSHTAPAAIVALRGGWTSHSSILARELEIPMVTGADLSFVDVGDLVVVDGYTGEIVVRPDARTLLDIHGKKESEKLRVANLWQSGNATPETSQVVIRVNLESSLAYDAARHLGVRGIGLYRSESLIPRPGKLPSEDEQHAAYSRIAASVGEAGINIRTFDIGPENIEESAGFERNPALGLRAIRLSLVDPAILTAQLSAILRANERGNISVVIPMVSGITEIRRFRELLVNSAQALLLDGYSVNMPRVGAMIEVPSAVLTAAEIAAEVDFICLGTNDLVQYLLAVDRDNASVADWYQTLHPAVLRAIEYVVAAGRGAGIPVTACGEMAGSPFYIPLLVGLGIRDLSMSAGSVKAAQQLIGGIGISGSEAIAHAALKGKTASEIDSALRRLYSEHWPSLFPDGFLDELH
ncbi:MAG: phosphoenolpyruvate--protein phosphotransferase [Pyrinomonadaceae bacterium]|nr:phosphoenolpyruvate--protein phosphotransferase [Pyrinomonadaceae bacterium]